ncbi:ABC-F family ATP-binding cassette domain-containing protein [Lacrimispora sp.]|uniref:ABC-F family ATP-binding cassette domain-containing protein n=1 Tax=Lacrimispora sp. TaxID=2719234 RepID=UPI002FD8D74F
MLYQIKDGTVTAGGNLILSHIDFEIHGSEKIAVTGKNGAGKTTLLRLIAGELDLDRDDKRVGPGIVCSRKLTVGYLEQQAFLNKDRTVEEEILSACPCPDPYAVERFEYEREYDRLFTGLGFSKEDKRKRISEFSGGEQTKIALIRHLLLKPDILLLDEPTNHLDIEAAEWLEQYMKRYEKAVVMVSHDRFFLDQTATVVYELSGGKLTRYPGNYSHYREEKEKLFKIRTKAYERQQEEIRRLNEVIERFKHKPSKASFARSKKKAIERFELIPKPEEDDISRFNLPLEPAFPGSKWVFESEHLKIGYDTPLLEMTMRVRRGQKIGILGANGAGKSTFLKTVAGLIPPVSGEYSIGNQITIGYFDQHSAEIHSDKSVAEHFRELFPSLPEKELRSILGAYLFGGKDAGKKVDSLSGGEKSRLVLAELLQSKPNFLVLDEPTNHMDIRAKETLESAFKAYQGTMLFVSHDRYFLSRVAESVLIFEGQSVYYYPFGYEHYLERMRKAESGESIAAQIKAEEQALIAGMRAVPKAERHRLREIPEEEAYLDWKLRLVMERLLPARERTGDLWERLEAMEAEWRESEDFWNGITVWEKAGEHERLKEEWERAWKQWHELCLEWYDVENGI